MKRILCLICAAILIGGSIAIAQSKGPSKPGNNPPPKQSPPPSKGPSTTPEKSPPPSKGPSTTPEKSPPQRGGSSGSQDYLGRGSEYLMGKPTPREYRPEERRRDDGPAFVPRTTGPRDMPSKVPQGDQRFNLGRPSDSRSPGVATIPRAVTVDLRASGNRGSLPYQVRRSEEYRVGLRVGYYHYDPWWQPYHYGYPYYVFVPTPYDCFFSPYYYYWTCPPYISARRIVILTPRVFIIISDPIRWVYCGYDTRYNYGYGSNYGYASYSSVDRAVSRLVDAFRYSDTRSLDELVPRGSTVDIYIEGDYGYSLSSDDYYDMTADMLQSVYTRNFVVERVQRTKDGDVWVVARHEFVDAWNATQRTWLGFLLERRGDRYVIRQAGTYSYRP